MSQQTGAATEAQDLDLFSTADAMVWAERFMQRATENPSIPLDAGTMVAWFAGAIGVGQDGVRAERDRARDIAVALGQQNAEALRIVRTAVVAFSVPGTPFRDGMAALRQAIRVLSGDTEEGPAL